MESSKISSWSDFSQRFLRFQRLAHGAELRLYRRHDGRRVRSDFSIKRRAINANNVKLLEGSDRVSELIQSAKDVLTTDIDARGIEMRLYGPGNDRVNGNTQVKTLRPESDSKGIDCFIELLSEAGVDDIPIAQAGKLYNKLAVLVGREHFEKRLLSKLKRPPTNPDA